MRCTRRRNTARSGPTGTTIPRWAMPASAISACTACKVGMLPACVTTCIGRATIFGDRTDPQSLVFEMIGSPRVFRLKEELGTQPSVYYLK